MTVRTTTIKSLKKALEGISGRKLSSLTGLSYPTCWKLKQGEVCFIDDLRILNNLGIIDLVISIGEVNGKFKKLENKQRTKKNP